MAKTLHKLIENVKNDYVDDEMKDIFYNMFYLQMFDIIRMIELITIRKIPINLDNCINTSEIIDKYFNCEIVNNNEKVINDDSSEVSSENETEIDDNSNETEIDE